MNNKSRIIITGVSGFLGRHVVEILKNEGMDVIIVDIIPEEHKTKILDVTS